MTGINLVKDMATKTEPGQTIVLCVVKNERNILPAFLEHYRHLGITRFIMLDNNSDDGTLEYLKQQPDVMLYFTKESYRTSFDSIKWVNMLADRHCTHHWTLVVDADEFLILPPVAQTILELTRHMEKNLDMGLYCPMVDFFAGSFHKEGQKEKQTQYDSFGQLLADTPFVMPFDNRHLKRVKTYPYHEINITGGLRGFMTGISLSPRLNKTPLVYWHPGHRFIKSTHEGTVLPLSFNNGVLCHFKYRPGFINRMKQERDSFDRQDAETILVTSLAQKGNFPADLQHQAVHIRQVSDLVKAGWLSPQTGEAGQIPEHPSTFPEFWHQENRTRHEFFPPLWSFDDSKTINGGNATEIATLKIAEKFQNRQINSLPFRMTKKLRIYLYERDLLPPDYIPELVNHPGGPVESIATVYESFWWAIGAPLRILNRLYNMICWRKLFSKLPFMML